MAVAADRFALVIGNGRSGTTIVGAILDAHPQIVCANETRASVAYWRDWTGDAIIADILANSEANRAAQRPSEEYLYAIDTPAKDVSSVTILADKIWNPTLLILAGAPRLISELSERVAPVSLLHCVRNPFDVIATMHRRSGASLEDRTRWYFMHCDAAQMLIDRGDAPLWTMRHEDLIADAGGVSASLFSWLGLSLAEERRDAILNRVFDAPRRTRDQVSWPADLRRAIEARARSHASLAGYSFEN